MQQIAEVVRRANQRCVWQKQSLESLIPAMNPFLLPFPKATFYIPVFIYVPFVDYDNLV